MLLRYNKLVLLEIRGCNDFKTQFNKTNCHFDVSGIYEIVCASLSDKFHENVRIKNLKQYQHWKCVKTVALNLLKTIQN